MYLTDAGEGWGVYGQGSCRPWPGPSAAGTEVQGDHTTPDTVSATMCYTNTSLGAVCNSPTMSQEPLQPVSTHHAGQRTGSQHRGQACQLKKDASSLDVTSVCAASTMLLACIRNHTKVQCPWPISDAQNVNMLEFAAPGAKGALSACMQGPEGSAV
jgi:hypothetical protein